VERNGTNVKTLKVKFVEKPQNATRDIPTAATFFWYPRGALKWDHPLIGVKCPGGWCFIGNEVGVPNWSANGQTKSRCTSEDETTDCVDVFGFHDEQRLAVSAGANGKKKLGDSWGLILPDKDLASKDIPAFDASEVTVATIRIWGSDYVKSFTLPAKAQLRMKLRHSGALPNDGWTASVEAKLDGSSAWTVLKTGLAVTREAHTDPVIGAARWEWDPNDEGVWVRCAAGCCRVTL
jgi:hypothetical protein